MDAWRSIHLLEGHEEECKNATDEKIVWKVVREVDEDEFRIIKGPENELFHTKYCPVQKSEFNEEDFANSFWALWPGNIEDDVKKLQTIIDDKNKKGKKNI